MGIERETRESETLRDWVRVVSGVWKTRVMGEGGLSPLEASGAKARLESLDAMEEAPFPFPVDSIRAERVHDQIHVSLPLAPEEEIHGLGLTFRTLDQVGRRLELRPDHYAGRDDGHTHAPLPFFISSAGYGVFLDTARHADVWVGRTHPAGNHPPLQDRVKAGWRAVLPGASVDFFVDAPGFDLWVLAGPTPLDAVRRYNLLCGGGPLPPKWGLGFWHRVHLQHGEKECLEVAEEYRKRALPLTVLGLEPGWHSGCYPTTHEWRSTLFPDPDRFIAGMGERGVKVNLWQNPFIHPECRLGQALSPYTCSHTGSWGGLIPDLTLGKAREIIKEHFRETLLNPGVSGFKHDEVEDPSWLFPRFATFPSGAHADEVHALLGLLMQRLTFEAFREAGRRTWGLVRGTHLGATYLPNALYNDSYSHPEFITALCASSFGGMMWTPEVRDSRTAEDWLRRVQAVCFSPVAMINAWASSQMPWSFPEVAEPVADAMRLRARLLPYLYCAFDRYAREGVPPMRAMHLEPGFRAPRPQTASAELHGTENPYSRPRPREVKDQFMFGDHILVAPFFAGEKERTVILPDGVWFDFYTGKAAARGEVRLTSELGPIPLFVRDGGIVPMLHEGDLAESGAFRRLEVRHYGTSPGRFPLYDDDGETFEYEQGRYSRWDLIAEKTNGAWVGKIAPTAGAGAPPQCDWRFMSAP